MIIFASFYSSSRYREMTSADWLEFWIVLIVLFLVFWGIPILYIWWKNRDTPKTREQTEQSQKILNQLQARYGAIEHFKERWIPQTWDLARGEQVAPSNDLKWHYGPTPTNSDPGRMWCYGCGGEVMWIKDGAPENSGGYVCCGCGKHSED